MSKARVWYSRGLSNVYDAVRNVRAADTAGEITLLASHARHAVPALQVADERFLEPVGRLPDAEFVAWCLSACREHRVDLFVPGRRVQALSAAKAQFEQAGTRLLVPAGPEALARIDRKDQFYADMHDAALPDFRVCRTVPEFDAACADLAHHRRLCVKPVVSTFGLGFHTLVQRDDPYKRFLGGDPTAISFEAARSAIASAKKPRDLLVMEYLPGPERSVDCLCQNGELVTAVSRVKRGEFQVLEIEGPGVEAARGVVKRYGLDGIVNVQTRNGRGEARLLEANARMSGGLLYACASGVVFPYWAIRLALGWSKPSEVPLPKAGVMVAATQGMVVVGAATDAGRAVHSGRGTPLHSRAAGSRGSVAG